MPYDQATSDLFRYMVLSKFGGLYLDSDFLLSSGDAMAFVRKRWNRARKDVGRVLKKLNKRNSGDLFTTQDFERVEDKTITYEFEAQKCRDRGNPSFSSNFL